MKRRTRRDEIVYPFSHPRPWDVDRALWRFFSFSLWNEIVSFGTCFVQGLTGQKPQSETCRLCTTGLWLGSYFFISHTAFDATCRSVWVVMKLAKVICKPRQSLVQSFSRPHHRPCFSRCFQARRFDRQKTIASCVPQSLQQVKVDRVRKLAWWSHEI